MPESFSEKMGLEHVFWVGSLIMGHLGAYVHSTILLITITLSIIYDPHGQIGEIDGEFTGKYTVYVNSAN